jgi:hypothetical protein
MAMEHDTGSGPDQRAISGTPDQQAAVQSPEPHEPPESADPAEPAGSADTSAGETASTGDPRVDAAIRRLTELDDLPLSEHPGVYERVHEQLVEVLDEVHAGQSPVDRGGTQQEHTTQGT